MFKEKNIIIKNPLKADIRFGLVYPNVYKTAMSSLGYQIIYNYINEREDTYSERIIYPSTRSLETNSPLSDFDIVSFSLQYEQDYFHVLEILREADIPLRREDRTSDDPLIIAGGPCASANPLPLSDFIDIFVVGEAEAVLYDTLAGSLYPASEASYAMLFFLFGGFDDLVLTYYAQSKILDVCDDQFH